MLDIDLTRLPWSMPGSRLFAFMRDGRLDLLSAEYETPVEECVVLRDLRVDVERLEQAVAAEPASLRWRDVHMTFDDEGTLIVVNRGATHAVFSAEANGAEESAGSYTLRLPGNQRLLAHLHQGTQWLFAENAFRLDLPPGGWACLHIGPAPLHCSAAHQPEAALTRTATTWVRWMERCPMVDPWIDETVQRCWYALGVNALHLRLPAMAQKLAVVPSLLGYVGVWQWDAYFIARGLRHGDLALAREQLDIALAFPRSDGQLPDVVHDAGVLAGFADLPRYEFEAYAAQSGLHPEALSTIPITKPPLTAWAVHALSDHALGADWLREVWPTLSASHEWWWHTADPGTGLPAYRHPFSSGLDDSPAFDNAGPRTTPDLLAYLHLQEAALDALAERIGVPRDHALADARRRRIEDALLGLWDAEAACFRDASPDGPSGADTVLTLLPLLLPALPDRIRRQLIAALHDPTRFGGPFRVPTVARRDPAFDAQRMWRGPVWASTNILVIAGLEASGELGPARELALETLKLIAASGGAFEYYDSETGAPAKRAVPCFSWTAALCVDLAVRFAAEAPQPTAVPRTLYTE